MHVPKHLNALAVFSGDAVTRAACECPEPDALNALHVFVCPRCTPSMYANWHARHRSDMTVVTR